MCINTRLAAIMGLVLSCCLVLVSCGPTDETPTGDKPPPSQDDEDKPDPPPPNPPNPPIPGDDDNDDEDPSEGEGDDPPPTDIDPMKLSGTWMTSCLNEKGSDGTPQYYVLAFVFDVKKQSWLQAVLFYHQAGCKLHLATQVYGGAMILGEAIEGVVYRTLDLKVSSITLSLHHPSLVKDFADTKEYGYNDWKIDEPKEIMGRKPNKGAAPAPYENFNVVHVKGDELFMSDFTDVKEKRSTRLGSSSLRRRTGA